MLTGYFNYPIQIENTIFSYKRILNKSEHCPGQVTVWTGCPGVPGSTVTHRNPRASRNSSLRTQGFEDTHKESCVPAQSSPQRGPQGSAHNPTWRRLRDLQSVGSFYTGLPERAGQPPPRPSQVTRSHNKHDFRNLRTGSSMHRKPSWHGRTNK